MDIDYDYIIEQSGSIQIYETGRDFLPDSDFRIVHSNNLQKRTNESKGETSYVKFA